MDFGWIVLGIVGLVLVLGFLHVMGQMVSEREYSGRRKQTRGAPLSDDSITHLGRS